MTVISPIDSVTALILAGGKATRMQELDKGLVTFNCVPLVQTVYQQIAPQCQTVLVNANRNIDIYQSFGYQVIQDLITGYQGPLAGFHAGLKHIQTKWMITLPCDGPFVATNYVARMLNTANANKNKIVVARNHKRLQPVYALLHHDLFSSLEEYLHNDKHKIDCWFAQHSYSTTTFSENSEMFININTLDELEPLEKNQT